VSRDGGGLYVQLRAPYRHRPAMSVTVPMTAGSPTFKKFTAAVAFFWSFTAVAVAAVAVAVAAAATSFVP